MAANAFSLPALPYAYDVRLLLFRIRIGGKMDDAH